LLQSWVPNPEIYFSCNSVSWFLSSLMFCYVAFPFVYRYASGCGLTLVLAIYAAVCLIVPYHNVNAFLYVHPLARFVDFFIGMAVYRMYVQHGRQCPASSWIEGGLIFMLLILLAAYPYVDAKFRNAPMYWLVLVPMLLVFLQQKGLFSHLLNKAPMMWLSSLSMPLFLSHQILLGILFHRLPQMPAPLMLFVSLAIVLIVSWGLQKIFSFFYR